jgi:hypothetical protein
MTVPTAPRPALDATTVAELNELLQLDYDAVDAYTLAIGALTNVGRRETVVRFREDHVRHIAELTRAIRRHGGVPADRAHATSTGFKLAMQRLGAFGGDRAVIVAFKTNEGQSCEKYTRAATQAGNWPDDLREIISVAADDEARHYEWAESQLEAVGAASDGTAGRVASAIETVHGKLADAVERVEAGGARGIDGARRGAAVARELLPERPSNRALAVGAVAAGVGFLITAALASAMRDRR